MTGYDVLGVVWQIIGLHRENNDSLSSRRNRKLVIIFEVGIAF